MAWTIEVSKRAAKAFSKLDKPMQKRIYQKLQEISALKDPRSIGKRLTGNLSAFWRYRVGDYRIVCDMNDGTLTVVVIDVGHRSDVYTHKFTN